MVELAIRNVCGFVVVPNVSYFYCWKCYSSSSVSNYLLLTSSFTQFSVTPSRFLTVQDTCVIRMTVKP